MKQQITYAIYARKSSESEERQVQSIDSQLNDLRNLALEANIEVSDQYVFTESKSAKDPYNRVEFEKLTKLIDEGVVTGILVWQMDRLFRNPIDGGKIQWLLQKEKLLSIQTVGKEYVPDDNSLLLSVESGKATQYVRDLSKKVKRGLDTKFSKGHHHGVAPHGYLNTKMQERGTNYIYPDPERFELIQRAWKMFLTGAYTAPQVRDQLNNEWAFTTVQKKRSGGNPLSYNGMYKIFSNIAYAGYVVRNGEVQEGKHEPMVSLEEFDKAQILLGRKGKPRMDRHEYAYTGLITCSCGGFVSATTKEKVLKSTGEYKRYILYYCTSCKPRWHINVDVLEPQIEKLISEISRPPQLKDLLLNYLDHANADEVKQRNAIYEAQKKKLADIQRKLDNLTGMRIRELIDDKEFLEQKENLKKEQISVKKYLKTTEQRIENWSKTVESYVTFASDLLEVFNDPETTLSTKREIVANIGWNCVIKDKVVSIELPFWAKALKDCKDSILSQYTPLELADIVSGKGKSGPNDPLCSILRGRRDSNPQPLA